MRKIFKSPEPQSLSDFNSVHYTNWKQIHERGNQHVYEDCMTQCLLIRMVYVAILRFA